MKLVLLLVASAALAALAAPLRASADEWTQPILVETLSSSLSPSASAEFDVRALLAVDARVDASALTEAQAEAYHAALLAQTITAEGKSQAQVRAEIEARGESMWAEFKARFARRYSSVAEEAKRYATFVANLARVAVNNAKAALSRLPARLRVVHSHLVEYADRTAAEFRAMLGTKPGRDNLPVAKPAPRGLLRRPGQPLKSFLEMDVSLHADDAADVDVDADAELDSLLDADADLDLEAEAEAESEATPALPKAGGKCQENGICVSGRNCPYSISYPGTGKCATGHTCCVHNTPAPAAPAPAKPAPARKSVPAPVSLEDGSLSGKTAAPIDCDFRADSTPIKNQGRCGSCWAFTAAAVLETAYRLNTGKEAPVLSPQQLLDCVPGSGADKCEGGMPHKGFVWAGNNGGLATESVYPYKETGGSCTRVTNSKIYVKPKAVKRSIAPCWSAPCKQDENELGHQLSANGPLAVGMDASNLQFYRSGVVEQATKGCSADPDNMNHAVVIEGLGTDKSSGQRYWIVRNSWATTWGENGRFRLAFGTNTCGIASIPTHVEM